MKRSRVVVFCLSVCVFVSPFPVTRSALVADVSFRRGDANADGGHDISDALSILTSLFLVPEDPLCADALDTDDDGFTNVTDAIGLLSFLFLGGAAPPPPFSTCGLDPTDDSLSCEAYGACRTATVSWEPPLQNEDGSDATDVAGFQIHYGPESRETTDYPHVIDVGDVTTYTFTGLPGNAVYFAVTAYDFDDNHSAYSVEVVKVLGGN